MIAFCKGVVLFFSAFRYPIRGCFYNWITLHITWSIIGYHVIDIAGTVFSFNAIAAEHHIWFSMVLELSLSELLIEMLSVRAGRICTVQQMIESVTLQIKISPSCRDSIPDLILLIFDRSKPQ